MHDLMTLNVLKPFILLQDDGNSELLQEQFAQNVDKSVVLEVYSSKEQSVRGMDDLCAGEYQRDLVIFFNLFNAEVTIVPSKSWHTPDKPEETSLIGMLIQSRSIHKTETTY
jgi:hypothetical protein